MKSGTVTDRAVTNVSYNPSYASNTLGSRAAIAGYGGHHLMPPPAGRYSAQSYRGMHPVGSAGSVGTYNRNSTTPSGPTRHAVYAYQNMGYANENLQGLVSGSAHGPQMASRSSSRPGSKNSQVSYQQSVSTVPDVCDSTGAGVHPLVAAAFAAQNPIPPQPQPQPPLTGKDTAL